MADLTTMLGTDLLSTSRTTINNNLTKIAQLFGDGATEPNPTHKNQLWPDEANDLLKMRNEGNTAWNIIGDLNTVHLGLDKTVMLDPSVQLVSRTTVTSGWVDVDITAQTGSNIAKFAILELQININGNVTDMRVRPNGSSQSSGPLLAGVTGEVNVGQGQRDANCVIVALDSGEIFEYEITSSSTSFTATIALLGYIC